MMRSPHLKIRCVQAWFVPAIVLAVLNFSAGLAATPDTAKVPYHPLDTLWHDFTSTVTDAGLIFARPLHFGTQDWLLTGGVVGGTALLMGTDESLREEMSKVQGTDGDRVMKVGTRLGDRLPGVILSGSLYVTGLVFNVPKIRVMGRHAMQSLAYAALVNSLLKYGLGRRRPFLNDGAFAFEGPGYHEDHYLSLPSGHTTIAFAIASSLAADIENPWATAGLYSLATFTAVSRMYHDRHWGSDVFLAAAISSAIGYGTANLHEADEADGTSFYIAPTMNGIAFGWTW